MKDAVGIADGVQSIYVASSWRNPMHTVIAHTLRAAGVPHVYDFKNDEGASFHWSEVAVPSDGCTFAQYIAGIDHDRAKEGFLSDFNAMMRADTFVLVLPCGRSAHLELGWAVGQGKRTAVLFDDPQLVTPELMYRACDFLTDSVVDLLGWLGVRD